MQTMAFYNFEERRYKEKHSNTNWFVLTIELIIVQISFASAIIFTVSASTELIHWIRKAFYAQYELNV